MGHFIGNCFLLFLLALMILVIVSAGIIIPILFWKSLRSGEISLQNTVYRRPREPLRYWLIMFTFGAFFLWKSARVDFEIILKPLWHFFSRR